MDYGLTVQCGTGIGSVACAAYSLPSQFVNAPTPTLHANTFGGIPASGSVSYITQIGAYPTTGGVSSGVMLANQTDLIASGTLPATAVAAGACTTVMATLPTNYTNAGQYFIAPGTPGFRPFKASPTGGMGATINTAPFLTITDVHYSGGNAFNTATVDICDYTAASITPATQTIYVSQ
jgi:hypothetical protein